MGKSNINLHRCSQRFKSESQSRGQGTGLRFKKMRACRPRMNEGGEVLFHQKSHKKSEKKKLREKKTRGTSSKRGGKWLWSKMEGHTSKRHGGRVDITILTGGGRKKKKGAKKYKRDWAGRRGGVVSFSA